EEDILLHTDDNADTDALRNALNYPCSEIWTGRAIPHRTSYEHLDLWLAGMPGFSRLTAAASAIERGHVNPTFAWGGPAIPAASTSAYLTGRPAEHQPGTATEHRGASEIGIRAHGPASQHLADTLASRVRAFDPECHAVIEVLPGNDDACQHGTSTITK